MLKSLQVDRVRELLAQGLSVRAVARLVGVARETVAVYADRHYHPSKPGPKPREELTPGRRRARSNSSGSIVPITERCPTCGGRVVMPCVLCEARAKHPIQAERLEYGTYKELHLSGYRRGGRKKFD